MNQEKISVIVPVYNMEAYLRNTLQSICVQSYDNLEIICVNDGSTDDSLAILQYYAKRDTRIQIIDQPNGGVSSARNAGLSKCSGLWVSFIDADDSVHPDCYQKLSNHLSSAIQMLCFWGEVVYDKELYETDSSEKPLIGLNASFLAGEVELNDYMRRKIPHSACNKIYRRDIIELYHIRFPEGIRIGEDMVFHMNYIMFVKKAYFMSDVFYYYIQREGSAMARSRARDKAFAHEMLYVSSRMIDFQCKHRLLDEHIYFLLKMMKRNFINAFFGAAYAARLGIISHALYQAIIFLSKPYVLRCILRKCLNNKKKLGLCVRRQLQGFAWLLGIVIRKFRLRR